MYIKKYARYNFNLRKEEVKKDKAREQKIGVEHFLRFFIPWGISPENIIILRLGMSPLIIKYRWSIFYMQRG